MKTVSFSKQKIHTGKVYAPETKAVQNIKKRNNTLGLVLWGLGVFFVSTVALATFNVLPVFDFRLQDIPVVSYFTKNSEAAPLASEKINLLLIGVGGMTNDAPDLTDTLIVASINTKLKTVSMLSIPRDLYVSYPQGGVGKMNEVYLRGTKKGWAKQGFSDLKDKVEEITGEKIDHYALVDFEWFVKVVDILGWIEIDVPEDIVDKTYPDGNWGYMTFSIKKGKQVLDGATALKYARSRHSTSDFDRSLRQQLVIKAIKEKALALNILLNPMKIKMLFSAISSNVKTDLELSQMISFGLFARSVPNGNIISANLNDSCFQSVADCSKWGLLYTPLRDLFGGLSVLLPDGASPGRLSEYTAITRFASLMADSPLLFIENYPIHIVNGTKKSGLAQSAALFLKKYGFNIPDKKSIWNSGGTRFKKTEIRFKEYENTASGSIAKSKTLEVLSTFFLAEQKQVSTLEYVQDSDARIEIVLGDDAPLFIK